MKILCNSQLKHFNIPKKKSSRLFFDVLNLLEICMGIAKKFLFVEIKDTLVIEEIY